MTASTAVSLDCTAVRFYVLVAAGEQEDLHPFFLSRLPRLFRKIPLGWGRKVIWRPKILLLACGSQDWCLDG